jgi:hypothetical protein
MTNNAEGPKALEPRFTLKQAAQKFFPNGPLTERSLRGLIARGALRHERVAKKILITESYLHKMLEESAHKCPAPESLPDSSSDATAAAGHTGQSETDRLSAALAVAKAIGEAPSRRSRATLRRSTSCPRGARHKTSSSRK